MTEQNAIRIAQFHQKQEQSVVPQEDNCPRVKFAAFIVCCGVCVVILAALYALGRP